MGLSHFVDIKNSKLMPNLRFAILDYPKLLMDNKVAQSLLSDVLTARQIGYEKASDLYISNDKLDMIGTHIVVFEVSNMYIPKVIAGLRLSYSDRCEKHSLDLPMNVNIQYTSQTTQNLYKKFKINNKCVVESNALFIDSNYSFSKTKIDLSQFMMTCVVAYILRRGHTNFITATNERFKTSRWVDFGSYPDGHHFIHPNMPDTHKVILVDDFYKDVLFQRFTDLDSMLSKSFEMIPSSISLKSIADITSEMLLVSKNTKAA